MSGRWACDEIPALKVPGMKKGIGSVDTAVVLLRIVEQAAGPLSLTQIARAAGFQLSKTHHYLVSLVRTGMLSQEAATGHYGLGGYALQLGVSALARTDTIGLAAQSVRALRDETGHTTFFSLWGDRGPLVVQSEQGLRPLSVHVRMGTVLPLSGSATANVFLAWMPEPQLREVLEASREARQAGLSARQYAEIKVRTRRDGVAHEANTRTPNVAALAAPVFAQGGSLAGALTLIGFLGEFDDRPRSKEARALQKHATGLSAALGFRPASGLDRAARMASPGNLAGRKMNW